LYLFPGHRSNSILPRVPLSSLYGPRHLQDPIIQRRVEEAAVTHVWRSSFVVGAQVNSVRSRFGHSCPSLIFFLRAVHPVFSLQTRLSTDRAPSTATEQQADGSRDHACTRRSFPAQFPWRARFAQAVGTRLLGPRSSSSRESSARLPWWSPGALDTWPLVSGREQPSPLSHARPPLCPFFRPPPCRAPCCSVFGAQSPVSASAPARPPSCCSPWPPLSVFSAPRPVEFTPARSRRIRCAAFLLSGLRRARQQVIYVEAAAAILCVVLARSGLVSSRNPKNRVKTELAARYFPSVRQIAWIGKSLPISWIRVNC
jgi:hypothetical protein